MKLTYKSVANRWNPETLNVYLGSVKIASIYYGRDNSKSETKCWRLSCYLCGFKRDTIKIQCQGEGKTRIESRVKLWLEWTGLASPEIKEQDNGA